MTLDIVQGVQSIRFPFLRITYDTYNPTVQSSPCTVSNVIFAALGATAETWREAILTSSVAALQPKRTKVIIALLEAGCCQDRWGPFWFKAVKLSPKQVRNFAYHDRMMTEIRRGTR